MTPDAQTRIATLSSYVPQAVLRHVVAHGDAAGGPHGDRFPAALLLVDITGFTPMTLSAIRRGPAGAEQLSRSLNAYLGQIIELVAAHGGDVAKIVGDAIIPIWPAEDGDLAASTRRAAACGLEIVSRLGELEVEHDVRLSLKVGVCAGDVVAAHVGGVEGRQHFLIAGPAVAQLSELQNHLQTGDVVASLAAASLVTNRFVGLPIAGGHVQLVRSEHAEPAPAPASVPISGEMEASVRAYIPEVLLSRLDAGHADWLAELRRTTVVFVNVRGLGDADEEGLRQLHRLTQAAQRVLGRYDGWLKEITIDDKGTTLLAAFGVPPFSHEDDPARAVRAALALQAEIRQLGLVAGIGLASGPTFCGPVGNERRRDFAMLGGHVNLAARLMQESDADGVLAAASTHDEARDRIPFERLPAYVLKGMVDPIDVYRARGVVVGDRPATLVDRRDEMSAAIAIMEGATAGVGGLVIIEGEPGIGKSRLVDEWLHRAREFGLTVLVGSASEIEIATPYHAWSDVFETILEAGPISEPNARRERVLEWLRAAGEDPQLAPMLDPLLSLDLPDNDVTRQLSGAVRADNTLDLLIRILTARASREPTLVILEDAHWLDSASWSLVFRARREIPRLLVVVTRRPIDEAADPVGPARSKATMQHLGPLSREDAVTLAAQRTGASSLADEVASVVQDRAEGNPLFIEQLTFAMRDAGRIVVDHGLLRAASETEDLKLLVIPDTVQRVITSRLDQLRPEQAMTLKAASVIGPRFALRTLRDLYPVPIEEDALVDHLATLTRLDLVEPAPSAPEPSYEFRHAITQEVAYNLMPPGQVQTLHRRLAEWYERTYAANLAPHHAFLAHHWRRAGVPQRAVDYLESAGAEAIRNFANDEAIGFLEQALALDADAGLGIDAARRGRWHLQLGEAHVHLSLYREGRTHLELGLRLLGDRVPSGRLGLSVALVGEVFRQGFHRLGLGLSGRIRNLTDAERADLVAICRAYERLAEASYYGRETLLPLYSSVRILNEAEASGSAPEIARGLAGTGALLALVPMNRMSGWYLQRALGRLDRVDDLTTHEIVRIVVGFSYLGSAKWDVAREQFNSVRGAARRLGDRRRLEDAVGNHMELAYLQGNLREAAELSGELIGIARARNDRRFEAEALVVRAYCAWHLGKTEAAARAVTLLREIRSDEPELPDELHVKTQGVLTVIHQGRGERQPAIAAAEEAMRLTAGQRPTYFGTFLGYAGPAEVYLDLWEAGQGPRDVDARAWEALSRLRAFAGVFPFARPRHATLDGRRAWLQGHAPEAMRSWRQAVAAASELSMPYELGLAHREIGRHLQRGDPERTRHLEAAREAFTSIEAGRALASVESALEASGSRPATG